MKNELPDFAPGDASTPRTIVVAIPVRDEEERIASLSYGFSRQTHLPTAVVLLLNNCTDMTEIIARGMHLPFQIDIQTVVLPAPTANAGTARRLAMDRAVALAGPDGIILTTDADAIVPPDWIALNLHALSAGADVVCGQAIIHPEEAAFIPAHLHEDDAQECFYISLLDAIADALSPDPADPEPRHTEAPGASLAMTVSAFLRAGGVPHVPSGEDRALIKSLHRIDARIRHDPAICVTVSGRMMGRASGGMADTIRRRMVRQDEFTDECVEPAGDAFRRADFRQRVRMVWAGERVDTDLAADLHLSPASLSDHMAQPFFGAVWAHIEQNSPMLRRRRVRFADLPRHIEYAQELLFPVSCSNRHHDNVAVEARLSYCPDLGYSKKGWQWLSRMSSVHYETSERNWRECCVNLSNSLCSSAQIWRISMRRCGCSIQMSGRRTSVPGGRGQRNAWFRQGECLRLIYDELREATQPVTTRELAERIMRVKAIPAADDRQRELIQKTLLGSLNRAKETIERIETAGVVSWRLI